MLKLAYTNQFRKDYKLAAKRGCNLKKLEYVLSLLCNGRSLPEKNRDHPLLNSKEYKEVRECHIAPDWLLIYRIENSELQLIRTGSHSDLFG